jgi:hypothetical protein
VRRVEGRLAAVLAATVSLAACAYPPMGPMIPVTPGPGKSMDAFTADQADCKQYADQLIVPSLWAVNQQTVGMALVGTALGAGLGAAIAGGSGAGIGAASGALVGTAAGASGAAYAQPPLQQQYDVTYAQCMAAHGDTVPEMGPPPPGYQGAPPPGYPAPPPR